MSAFYVHMEVADRPGVLAQIAEVLGMQGASIKSFVQRGLGDNARLVMVLHPLLESRLYAAVRLIGQLDFMRAAPRAIRVIDEEFVLADAGLIERYRERLPFAPEDPVVSLGEGSTPLVLAERLSERAGAEVWLKIEGANPTGSFKDRGMTCAVSAAVREGAEALVCASTGNTAAQRGRLRRARRADGRRDRARGQDRHRQARPGADARRARDRAARQLRPGARARARARRAAPDRARELGQPVPAGGPEDRRRSRSSTSSARSTRCASRSATRAT